MPWAARPEKTDAYFIREAHGSDMYVPNTIVTIEVVVTKYDWKYRGLLTDASDNTFLNTFLSSLEDPDGARILSSIAATSFLLLTCAISMHVF